MQDCTLELASCADARPLAQMSQELIEAGLRPSWSAARIAWHIRHPESVVLTARQPNAIAGFAVMRYGDELAHLNLLAVAPVFQRHGVARRMMIWLEETALTAGTFTVSLELRARNSAAYAFYTNMGYREVGRVSGYYQGIEPAVRMVRDLRATANHHTP
jgi:[ribosomal protein S18]-alanine N-acetyltransferase